MSKFYSFALMALLSVGAMNAQTLLDEDFENDNTDERYNPNIADGWTTIDSYTGNYNQFRWHNYYTSSGMMTGKHCASVDASTYDSDPKAGFGPREEVLLTPDLVLDNTYQLSFDFLGAAAYVFQYKAYDFEVRIYEGENSTTIWTSTNEDDVRNSGITTFPWAAWTAYNAKLDLSAFQGKTVKVGFVYNQLKKSANSLYIDNVSVKQFNPVTAPIAQLSTKLYNFGSMYIGEKVYSSAITLKNTGKAGLTVSSVECPDGITTTLKPESINLGLNETVDFQVCYSANFTTTADGTITIKTNGGDVTLRVLATKETLPDGMNLETFEGDQFPPAGWTNTNWTRTYYALEGDYSAYTSGYMEDQYLVSPRLDCTGDDNKVMFTYYNDFSNSDSDYYPSNDISVEVSTDGGQTWTQKWITDYTDTDKLETVTIDLGANLGDNVYVRFHGTAVESDDDGAYEYSDFYLDRILLPAFYGQDGAAVATTYKTPANEATDLYNHNVSFTWEEAQFATGYKFYLGKSESTFDVINGEDLGNVTSYTVKDVDNATTYFWKVVPYNSVGDATDAAVWSFTTQADQTVTEYPYFQGFEDDGFPPLGWYMEREQYTYFTHNNTKPYDGRYCVSATSRKVGEKAYLTTQEFVLPTDKAMQITFWWGNDMAVSLINDDSTIHTNPTTGSNEADKGTFEIYVDGEWHELTYLSDPNPEDTKYWLRERFDLSDYAGKTVMFRWTYEAYNYNKADGISIDNITIDVIGGESAEFNADSWDAGKVNYGESLTSKTMAAVNFGNEALTVAKVEFSTQNFETTIQGGEVIDVNGSLPFTVTFNAKNSATTVKDEMVVTFSNGGVATLPVQGTGMAADVFFFGFEQDTPGKDPAGFTTIDVDGKATPQFWYMSFPNYGLPFAFSVQNTNQWNNVFDCPTGEQVLVNCTPADGGTADDWVISQKFYATSQSSFELDCRNWESVNSILPGATPTVSVLVSTTSNTDRTTFEEVGSVTLDLYDTKAWTHLNYDLSKYAGQPVYIAVRHYVTDGLASFYDNFQFNHFVKGVAGDINLDGIVDITDVNIVINTALGKVTLEEYGGRADLNGDGIVDITDVNNEINYVLDK